MHLIITQQPAFRPWEDKEESAVQGNEKEKGRVRRRGNAKERQSSERELVVVFSFGKRSGIHFEDYPRIRLCKNNLP